MIARSLPWVHRDCERITLQRHGLFFLLTSVRNFVQGLLQGPGACVPDANMYVHACLGTAPRVSVRVLPSHSGCVWRAAEGHPLQGERLFVPGKSARLLPDCW